MIFLDICFKERFFFSLDINGIYDMNGFYQIRKLGHEARRDTISLAT